MWTAQDIALRATLFSQSPTGDDERTFEMPEDLAALDDGTLAELGVDAVSMFEEIYEAGEDQDLTDDQVEALETLAWYITTIRAEEGRRAEARQAARQKADELAAQVAEAPAEDAPVDEAAVEEPAAEAVEEPVDEPQPEPVTASTVRVRGVPRSQPAPDPQLEPVRPTAVIAAAADVPGHSAGQTITTLDIGRALTTRARGMNRAHFEQAYKSGRRMRQQYSLASIRKAFPAELVASSDTADAVLAAAVDESRLPGGSLVASGGWCAPSETLYDLFEVETTDGLISVPEIQVTRGGIRHTPGPDFSSIFDGSGYFTFSEDEDTAGDYDGYGGGEKPLMKVDCPEFVDDRLNVAGVQITAGILQESAYPETVERFVRGALVAHEHKMAERVIGAMVAQSTVVTMPADPVGALAPTLQAIEVQIEDYRQRHRLARATSLEVILPYWVRGAIRSDLSRRLGVEMTNVTDAVIGAHLTARGANVQFVYNFDDMTGSAASRTAWPTQVKALIYAAGTFVKGVSDVITLDAVYDSALFRVNDYTALFSEEGWLVAKRGHDSRIVTIPICADGHTAGGVAVDCDGSQGENNG